MEEKTDKQHSGSLRSKSFTFGSFLEKVVTLQMMKVTDNYAFLTKGPIHRVIGTLAVPTTISMLITNIYNIVDTFFVGQIDTQSTAAVGVVFSLMFVVQAFSFLFGNGSGNYIARQLGAKDKHHAERMASTAFFYAICCGTLITIVGLVFLTPISKMLGSTPTILPYTEHYLGISLFGIPFLMGSFCINNQMRFQGYARYSMYGMVSGAVLNCVLDPILIFGLKMGVGGAALATDIGYVVGFVVMLQMTRMNPGIIRYSSRRISFSRAYVKEILAGGTPSVSRQGLAAASTIALNFAAGSYGDAAIAAMSIVNRISMFVYSVVVGVGQGFQPLCGFCFGAQLYDRVKEGFYFCLKIGTVFLVVWAVVLFFVSEETIALFRNDPEVIAVGTSALHFQIVSYPLIAVITISNMLMQTCRKTLRANVLAAARQGLFFVPLIFILPHYYGLAGVESCQAVSDVLAFLLTVPLVYWAFREMV